MKLGMSFGEALGRFARTNPKEIVEAAVAEALQEQQAVDKRITVARKELDDGARPRKGRFRL